MNNEQQRIEELAVNLFNINAVKFGEFDTKSGIKTPVYFDLRVIVSYPDVMELISDLIYEFAFKEMDCVHICGVPYTALPIATLLSVRAKKSMLMRRKEAKAYGTKKMIEGHYEAGQSCLIIEDVITSGSSVLETVKDLRKEGLKADRALIILDREQGGRENLAKNDVQIKSLFTMSKLIEILVQKEKIDNTMANKVKKYLLETPAAVKIDSLEDRTLLTYEQRSELSTNTVAKRLFHIMSAKKSNLCLSIDLTSTIKILDMIEKVGEHICLLKTHADIIEDFNTDFTVSLKNLAKKFNFLILEDRKFADIGNTVALQYSKGIHKIAEWADCVTVHSLPGEGILKAINNSCDNGIGSRGVFLLAEMSSEGNLITTEYTAQTVKMASKYPNVLTGFVCQTKESFNDPRYIQLTPGVQFECSKDELGQVYNTPEKVILEKGADVVVVGRGIVTAKNPEAQAVLYKNVLWSNYLRRVSGKIE
ncbi:unnamed protein product [Diatraea saccharalis]|uniref:Uridine 5'-monophosphate synthase n=1 Tax=Diatraea saccharalis TaxID=40085 RepID=A0A9N9QZ48_9NEOP|nr:unnamed protein product [Diatraea saccharalis]CAG9786318.1 unnamed protein product [Diatraea saccharalis]